MAQRSPGETMAAQVRPGGTIATPLTQVRLSDAEGTFSPLLTNDPACWMHLTKQDTEYITKIGQPENPKSFPRDSSGRSFPQNIFGQEMPNGKKGKKRLVNSMERIKTRSLLLSMLSVSRNITKREDL